MSMENSSFLAQKAISIHNSCIFFAIYAITPEETKALLMLQESLGSFTTEGLF